MGRMKEMYINICNANGGDLPEGLTTADVARMKELEIYEWQEYVKKQSEINDQVSEDQNSSN